jgi:hypothetical protein
MEVSFGLAFTEFIDFEKCLDVLNLRCDEFLANGAGSG